MTRSVNRSARAASGMTRTLPRRTPRPDSIAGIFATASSAVPPLRRMTRAVHPHASPAAEAIRDPGSPIESAIDGHACTVRSILTRERRRRCAHHGMPRITVPIPAICGSGRTDGPSAIAAVSHPPADAMTTVP